jgi:hypothetical protein
MCTVVEVVCCCCCCCCCCDPCYVLPGFLSTRGTSVLLQLTPRHDDDDVYDTHLRLLQHPRQDTRTFCLDAFSTARPQPCRASTSSTSSTGGRAVALVYHKYKHSPRQPPWLSLQALICGWSKQEDAVQCNTEQGFCCSLRLRQGTAAYYVRCNDCARAGRTKCVPSSGHKLAKGTVSLQAWHAECVATIDSCHQNVWYQSADSCTLT